jgi:hypothetical protein
MQASGVQQAEFANSIAITLQDWPSRAELFAESFGE